MAADAAVSTYLTDLRPLGRDDRVLFTLTDAGSGHEGLSLPFRDAVVVDRASSNYSHIEGQFDAVVVDENVIDADWRETMGRVLRPGGRVIVALSAADSAVVPEAVDGMAWHGFGTVRGRPFIVLTMGERADAAATLADPVGTSTAARVAIAGAAFRAGLEHAGANRGRSHVDAEWAEQTQAGRRRSELALLTYLEAVASQLDQERRRARGIRRFRTVLQRHRAGRVLLLPLLPLWRVGRRLYTRLLLRRVKTRTGRG